jgi:hypothetical protein
VVKKKTSLNLDDKLWRSWVIYVTQKYGTTRKISDETATALEEYMQRHEAKE